MASVLVSEGRRPYGAGNGHDGNGNGHEGRERAGSKAEPADDESMRMLQEIMRLLDASKEGRLTERGKATLFNGVNREMIQGVNEMLDAILLPIGRGQPHPGADFERQDRRADRPYLPG